jgi:hypothetical protein
MPTLVLSEQEDWRQRLAEAEYRYRQADRELQCSPFLTPDDARAHKMAARQEYLRVLRIFTDLVLRGKSPDDSL